MKATNPNLRTFKKLLTEMNNEYELDQLRKIRNQKLSETDKYCLVDWPQTAEEKETRLKYRQQLRDLPQLYLEKMVGDYSISGEVLYVDGLVYNFFVQLEPLELVEPVTETISEPVTETISEPVVEPVETLAEPDVEHVTELVTEPVT